MLSGSETDSPVGWIKDTQQNKIFEKRNIGAVKTYMFLLPLFLLYLTHIIHAAKEVSKKNDLGAALTV